MKSSRRQNNDKVIKVICYSGHMISWFYKDKNICVSMTNLRFNSFQISKKNLIKYLGSIIRNIGF